MKARKARIILIIILVISMLMLNSCTALYKGLGRLGQFMGILYSKMVDYLKKALIYGHTSRISS